MSAAHRQSGFSVTEVLVAMSLFMLLAGSFYRVMQSGVAGSKDARNIVRVSEEARLALNRMIRDTREADSLSVATSASYTIKVDFNGDGMFQNPNVFGDYEELSFFYSPAAGSISLNSETLIEGVQPIPGKDLFSYSSNNLEFDSNGDGFVAWQEIDQATAQGAGNGNGVLDDSERQYLSSVHYAFQVTSGKKTSDFYAEAELRNRR